MKVTKKKFLYLSDAVSEVFNIKSGQCDHDNQNKLGTRIEIFDRIRIIHLCCLVFYASMLPGKIIFLLLGDRPVVAKDIYCVLTEYLVYII